MIKGKTASLQNRLKDSFTTVVNAVRQSHNIRSNCYSFYFARPYSFTSGKEWMVAIPSLKNPELYTVSHIREKTVKTAYGTSSSTHNRKLTNPDSEDETLFSFSGAMIELKKFEDKMDAETQHSKAVNSMNYRLCE